MNFKKMLSIAMSFLILSGFTFKSESNLTEEKLADGLLYELKPLASTFINIEKEYKINSVLYSSIVALESGWGQSNLSKSKNNITSCRNLEGFKSYKSKEDSLYDMAEILSKEYLNESGKYYEGGTKIENVVSFYLLGKSKANLNLEELKQIKAYADAVKEIYNGIIERVEENNLCPLLVDKQTNDDYNDNNNN